MPYYIHALGQTLRSSLALAQELTDKEWTRPTRCPGWDVHDQIAHIVGVEAQLAGGPVPPEVPVGRHVTGPVGAYLERSVQARRGVSGSALVSEFEQVIARRMAQLRARPIAPDDLLPGVVGQRPVRADRLLGLRIFDCWAHEQDVRAALGRRGNVGTDAADVAWQLMARAVPRAVARLPEARGRVIGFDLVGSRRVARTFHVADDGTTRTAGDDERPEVVLRMEFLDFAARACGRLGSPPVEIAGDTALARRVIDALIITPLTAHCHDQPRRGQPTVISKRRTPCTVALRA